MAAWDDLPPELVARILAMRGTKAACSVIARGGSSVARHGVNAVLGKEALLEGERAAVAKLVHVHLPGVVRDLPARVVVQFLGHLAIEFQPDLVPRRKEEPLAVVRA
eukprot:scaffold25953_cov99-Isochrysis_galbana.AAC.1